VRKADNLQQSCAIVAKSGNLIFLEPSGPVQACKGTDLTFTVLYIIVTSDIYYLYYFTLFHTIIQQKILTNNRTNFNTVSNLTHLTTLYYCNRNVTVKMAGLTAETCSGKYHIKIQQRN